jgi:hypothetical protein
MTAGHRNRLYALEMLLRSRRTTDPDLRDHYERLSQLWLALAERGEGMSAAPDDFPPPSEGLHLVRTSVTVSHIRTGFQQRLQ